MALRSTSETTGAEICQWSANGMAYLYAEACAMRRDESLKHEATVHVHVTTVEYTRLEAKKIGGSTKFLQAAPVQKVGHPIFPRGEPDIEYHGVVRRQMLRRCANQ